MKKTFLSILFIFLTYLLFVPMTVYATTNYDLWIGGTRVTSENLSGEGWTYNPSTNVLTLDNYNYTSATASIDDIRAGIYSKNDIVINLIGKNIINEMSENSSNSFGIFVNWNDSAKLTFKGNGVLTSSGTTTSNTTGYSNCGIAAGELVLDKDFTGTINANGGTSSASNAMATMGLYTKSLTVNSGTINAQGGTASNSYASSSGIFMGAPATININGGTVNTYGGTGGTRGQSVGLWMYGEYEGATGTILVEKNATLSAKGSDAQLSYGITFENSSGGSINISSGANVTCWSTNTYTGNSMGDVNSCGLRTDGNSLTSMGNLTVYTEGTSTRTNDTVCAIIGGTGSYSIYEGKGYTNAEGTEGETILETEGITSSLGSYKRVITNSSPAATTYTICYRLEGGNSPYPSNPESYTSASDDFTLNNPTRSGYIFMGWIGEGLEEPTIEVTITKGSTGNRTYTAVWGHTVSFELNGGSMTGTNPVTVNDGETVTRPDIDPVKENNLFVNWYSDAGLTSEFDFSTPITADTTIYAKYTQYANVAIGTTGGGKYTITGTEANNETEAMNLLFLLSNNPVTFTATPEEGYHFVGWYEGIIGSSHFVEDHTTTLISSSASYTTSVTNLVVMAVFEADSVTTYKVSFNANGGTGTMEDIVNLTGSYMLPLCYFTAPEGKQFKGWSLTSDGEIITMVEMTEDKTVYAIWEDIKEVIIPVISLSTNNNTFTLSWENQELATKYEVSYSNDKKKWTKNTVTTNSYIAKKLTYNKKYYFKVRAYDGTKWTQYSNIVGKKVVPNKVENLHVIIVGTNNVKLGYDRVAVSGYEIYSSTDNKKWNKAATVTKNATLEYNIKKLKANKTYYFKVRAYKTVSGKKVYGSFSSVLSTKTAPDKPVVSLTYTYNSIKATYAKVGGASRYEIYRSLSNAGTYEKIGESTELTYIDSGLVTGQTYYYKVRACNTKCGSFSSIVYKKPILKAPSVTLISPYKGYVDLTIGSVPGEDGYEIYYSSNASKDFNKVADLDVSTSKYTHESTSLKANGIYYYKIRAYRIVNEKKVYGSWSKVKAVTISTKILVKLKSIKLNVENKIAIGSSKNVVVTYNPTNKVESIRWETSDDSIATVENGIITGIAAGMATITATTTSGITNSVTITVYKPAESFMLSDTNITMYINDTMILGAVITPDDATFKDVNYNSSNPTIVAVNNNGQLTAKAEGTAKITVSTDEGISRECTVIVKERPLVYSGIGDSIITNVNIPRGEYVAHVTFTADSYNSLKFYYGDDEYDYELLVNEIEPYSGTTLLKDGSIDAVNDGILQIKTDGAWTVTIEKLTGSTSFPLSGSGDTVTGLFDGTGKQEIFDVTFTSDTYNSIKIYELNGDKYDYDLLVNETDPYTGKVMFRTEKGKKYFLVIRTDSDGGWSIKRQDIDSSVSFPITGTGSFVTGLFDGTGNRIIFNVSFYSDGYNGLKVYKYKGDYFDYDLLVNETDPYSGQVMVYTEKGAKYFFVIDTDGGWSISK